MRKKRTVANTSSYGDIKSLLKAVEDAISSGATSYGCHIQYLKQNDPYVQMIEFTKIISEREILEIEKNKLLKRIEEINKKI